MPISNLALLVGRGTVTIPIGDETLTVVYDPNKVNAASEEVFRVARLRGTITAMARNLINVIVEWDVVLNGEPIAPDDLVVGEGESVRRFAGETDEQSEARPFIETLSQMLLQTITDAINDDLGKLRTSGSAFGAGVSKRNGRKA